MTQKIQLKRSAIQGSVPTTTDLDLGEVAINTYDGKVFLKKNVNGTESIVDITNPAVTFSSVSSKPTTLSGYGITDAYTKTEVDSAISAATPTFSSLTGKPTTLSGYGITDTYTKTEIDSAISAATPSFSTLTGKPTTLAGYGITDSVELTNNKGAANGYAPLDSSTKIASAYLPSYVDDVLEYADLASFPGTGETGKIYVTLDSNKTYRWSGSAYIEISASPGSTDAVTEGTTNLYFTDARAQAAVTSVTGNAGTATKLATARTISGVSFDGTANINIPYSGLTSKPTTLAGYGITDALSSSANSTFTLQYGSITSGTWSNVGYNLQTVDSTAVTGNSTGAMIKYTIHAILTDAAHPDMRMRESAEVVLLYFPSTSNAAANGTISGVVELNEYAILTTGLSDLNTLNAGAGVTSTQMLTFGARFNGSNIELLVFLPSYAGGYLPANGAITINFVKTII